MYVPKRVAYTVAAVGRPWPTLTAIAIALILVVSAGAADFGLPAPEGPANDRVGFSTSTVWLPAGEGFRYLREARDGGVTWVREDFAWSTIEPSRGQFAWSRTDALMRNTAQLGLRVLAIATYTPGWATGHPESDKYPPSDPADFARVVAAVTGRYGPRGTFWKANPRLAPFPLTAIEIWNEPWLGGFWHGGPDPAGYARLVRAAATAIKARDPGMQVLASGDAYSLGGQSITDWLDPLLRADPDLWRSRLVDAWSVHLYCGAQGPGDTAGPPTGRFDRLLITRSIAQQAEADKPIWVTELGWSTDPARRDSVDEQTQAEYERQALALIATQWSSFVPRSFVYTWAKPSPQDQYNLIRPNGSKRPAWQAIQAAIAAGA
jgi:hypothetical protein